MKEKKAENRNELLLDWFVVDKTHCILIFNHSLDELALGQSLCEGTKTE